VQVQPRHRGSEESPLLGRVRSLCLSLPETSEAGSWGHPNFRAGKRTFVTYEWIKRRPSIALRLCPAEVARYAATPGFFLTPYGRGQWVSLEADRRVNWRLAKTLILESYRLVALKRMTQALDRGTSRRNARRAI
jgi:predicted DNA-binding protein (MmcQ/YjbR family)